MGQQNVVFMMRAQRCTYCDVGYAGMGHVLAAAQARLGLDITDLGGDLASEAGLRAALQAKDPLLFIGFGHGSPTVFTGQDTEPVLKACVNDGLMAGRIVYLHSCLTGQSLGPSMVSKGAVSYMGYKEAWTWVMATSQDPYNDVYARGFFEAANEVALALVNGLTPGDAVQLCIAKHDQWIDYWSRSSDPNAPEVVKWHTWDRDALTLVGSSTERATSPAIAAAAVPVVPIVSLIVGTVVGSIPKRPRDKLIAFAAGTGATAGIGLLVQRALVPSATLKAQKGQSSRG